MHVHVHVHVHMYAGVLKYMQVLIRDHLQKWGSGNNHLENIINQRCTEILIYMYAHIVAHVNYFLYLFLCSIVEGLVPLTLLLCLVIVSLQWKKGAQL